MAQGFDGFTPGEIAAERSLEKSSRELRTLKRVIEKYKDDCLLYTSPSPRD